jgi:16S rRNA (cytosine1402-N4)-methyltransferase
LKNEVLAMLACSPGKHYVDLTLGGGGHAEAILEATAPDGLLVGADRDSEALTRAGKRLQRFGHRVKLLHGDWTQVSETLRQGALPRVDGVLIDCGVSSDQLMEAHRGFSFSAPGPLDMRMDATRGRTAREWLKRASEREIADVLFRFGEERFSRSIAREIVNARAQRKLETTADLVDAVLSALPPSKRAPQLHPATRTFQAVRIHVNEELAQLEEGLRQLFALLPAGARLAVIAFHSLEDRIVKTIFKIGARDGRARILTPKPVRPTPEEENVNPRARSARFRAVEILEASK